MYHKSVLLKESVDALNIEEKRGGTFVDLTFGGGGHSKAILERLDSNGRLLVFDQDEEALANVPDDKRIVKIRSNFRFLENHIKFLGVGMVDGIIADLGVSSHQFDTAQRGFSYRFDAELDMRMNQLSELKAADIVNNYGQQKLAMIFKDYGEIEGAGKVAAAVCSYRETCTDNKIISTEQLKEALAKFYNQQTERKFLGKVFQALRIEVNQEIRALEDMLAGGKEVLANGGRFSVITYHSLEDRIVKNFFRQGKADGIFGTISKKPILPNEDEISANGRSRSAKLRYAEKVRANI